MTVADYVRRRRLTLAAQELADASRTVLDVALKYGWDSPESFSKAFKRFHQLPPSLARRRGATLKAGPRITFHISVRGEQDMDYRIIEQPSFWVTGPSWRLTTKDGENFRQIPGIWERSYHDGTVAQLRNRDPERTLLGICAEADPSREEFTYLIAAKGQHSVPNSGWRQLEIPAATWAIFNVQGALPDAIQQVWRRIFEEWFPSTGYEHSGGPELERLFDGDDLAPDYRCEVWIPVQHA